MEPLILEVPPTLVSLDETHWPDRDNSRIYEHLLHFLQLSGAMPVIGARLTEEGLVVTFGHKYLRAARALHRPSISVTIDTTHGNKGLAVLQARPDVRSVDWRVINAAERERPWEHAWQVFFFDHALSAEEKMTFEAAMARLFARPSVFDAERPAEASPIYLVSYDDERHLAQFQAWTPVEDEEWMRNYTSGLFAFSRKEIRIVSYEGRRLEVVKGKHANGPHTQGA